jgi:hypothetical protein
MACSGDGSSHARPRVSRNSPRPTARGQGMQRPDPAACSRATVLGRRRHPVSDHARLRPLSAVTPARHRAKRRHPYRTGNTVGRHADRHAFGSPPILLLVLDTKEFKESEKRDGRGGFAASAILASLAVLMTGRIFWPFRSRFLFPATKRPAPVPGSETCRPGQTFFHLLQASHRILATTFTLGGL